MGRICGVQQGANRIEEDLAMVVWRATEPTSGWLSIQPSPSPPQSDYLLQMSLYLFSLDLGLTC